MIFGDTIAAIATARGRGGVAIVRVSGPDAFLIAEKSVGLKPEVGRVQFVRFKVDEGLLLSFRSPHSYTGEDVVEFHCHGGEVTPQRVLDMVIDNGARLARRGEFTERALINGKLDYDQAESVLNLIDAKTRRAADAALAGLSGRKKSAFKDIYDHALELSSQLEHALDIDEGELPADFLPRLQSRILTLKAEIDDEICRANEGRILRNGALVVLAGPPNAGKSSLMNALLETNRAIVSDTPGTTRDSIEEWLDIEGWPIRLVDTAGIRETENNIEREGVKRAEDLMAEADIILWLSASPRVADSGTSIIRICAKCDLVRGDGLNVSSKTGEGLSELKNQIVRTLKSRLDEHEETSASDSGLAALQEAKAILSKFKGDDLPMVLMANQVRAAAEKLAGALGVTYTEDLLKNLFSRFCVGK